MSQADLAASVTARGLSFQPSTVYKIEQAKRKVLASEVPVIGSALGIPAANILGLGEDRSPLLTAGARLEESLRHLQFSALAYARAMLAFAQAADAAENLHPNDYHYAAESLPRQTPAWIASADVLGSIEATLKLNRVEVTGDHAKAVISALKADRDKMHGPDDG